MLKSLELKKTQNNSYSTAYPKGIKLKFENIKTEEELQSLNINDEINI
jgi:hypothetical protein